MQRRILFLALLAAVCMCCVHCTRPDIRESQEAEYMNGFDEGIENAENDAEDSKLEQPYQFSRDQEDDSIALTTAKAPFISIQSAGLAVGNFAKFKVNGKFISISSGTNRGLNVIIFDQVKMTIRCKHNFDTHLSTQNSQLFVNLINSLPAGRIVAIAVKDEAQRYLTEAAKRAIEGLGSRYIRQIKYRGSLALLGRKGAPQGTVLEAASNVGPTEIISQVLPVLRYSLRNRMCRFFVDSAGLLSAGGLQLTINGRTQKMPARRGIRVAIIKENSCAVESLYTYDTHGAAVESTKLSQLIANVHTGRIVIASVYDEAARALQENAKRALESIGSSFIRSIGYRDAWAIVGRKGAAKGTVPESFIRSASGAGSSAVAVGGSMKLVKLQPC